MTEQSVTQTHFLSTSAVNSSSSSTSPKVDALLESRFVMADEQSVLRLNEHITQIHMLKLELEAKERLLSDLRRQVAELAPLKEEVNHLQSLLNKNEERLAVREAEYKKLYSEHQQTITEFRIVDSTSAGQIRSLEESIAALQQRYSEKDAETHAHEKALQSDLEAKERNVKNLEKEVFELTNILQTERRQASERDQKHREVNNQLHQQVTVLQKELSDQLDKSSSMELCRSELKRELKDQSRTVDRLKESLEAAEARILELVGKVNILTSTNRQLSDVVEKLKPDTQIVARLQAEVSSSSEIQDQFIRTKKQLFDTQMELERIRTSTRMDDDEKRQYKTQIAELQQRVNELTNRIASTTPLQILSSELGRRSSSSRIFSPTAEDDSNAAMGPWVTNAMAELRAEFLTINAALDAVLKGNPLQLQAFDEHTLNAEFAGGLKSALVGLRSRLIELSAQFRSSMDRVKVLSQSHSLSHTLELEKAELQAQCITLKGQVDTLTHVLREQETLNQKLSADLQLLRGQKSSDRKTSELLLQISQRLAELNASIVIDGDFSGVQSSSLALVHAGDAGVDELRGRIDAQLQMIGSRVRKQSEVGIKIQGDLRATIARLEAALHDVQGKLSEAERSKQSTVEKVKAEFLVLYQNQVHGLQASAEEAEKRASALSQENTVARRKSVQLSSEVTELRSDLAAMQLANDQLTSEITHLKAMNELLQKDLASWKLNRPDEGELDDLRNKNVSLQQQLDAAQAALRLANAEKDKISKEILVLQTKLATLSVDLDTTRSTCTNQSDRFASQALTIENLQKDLLVCHEEIESLSSQLRQARAEADSFRTQCDAQADQSRRLWTALVLTMRAWLGVNGQLRALRANKNSLSHHAQDLHTTLQTALRELRQLAGTGPKIVSAPSMRGAALAVIASLRLRDLRKKGSGSANAGRRSSRTGLGGIASSSSSVVLAPVSVIVADDVPAFVDSDEAMEEPARFQVVANHMCSAEALASTSIDRLFNPAILRSAFLVAGNNNRPRRTLHVLVTAILQRLKDAEALAKQKSDRSAEEQRLQAALQAARERIAALEADCNQKLLEWNESLAAKEKRCASLESQLDILRKEKADLMASVEGLQADKRRFDETLHKLRSENGTLSREVTELRQSLHTATEEHTRLTLLVDQKLKEVDANTQEISRLTKQTAHRNQEITQLQQEKEQIAAQSSRLTTENQTLLERLRSAARECDDLKYRMALVQHQLSELESKNQHLNRSIKRKEQRIAADADMLRSLNSSHAKISQELAITHKELFDVQQSQQKEAMERGYWARMRIGSINRRIDAEQALDSVLRDAALLRNGEIPTEPLYIPLSTLAASASASITNTPRAPGPASHPTPGLGAASASAPGTHSKGKDPVSELKQHSSTTGRTAAAPLDRFVTPPESPPQDLTPHRRLDYLNPYYSPPGVWGSTYLGPTTAASARLRVPPYPSANAQYDYLSMTTLSEDLGSTSTNTTTARATYTSTSSSTAASGQPAAAEPTGPRENTQASASAS